MGCTMSNFRIHRFGFLKVKRPVADGNDSTQFAHRSLIDRVDQIAANEG